MKILDVGCGGIPHGDVNVDLFIEKTVHRDNIPTIQTQKIKNFVRADVQFLPFGENSFDLVYSYHVIEHVDNPILMLKEMIRVSRRLVRIYTPHRMLPIFRKPQHKRHFTRTWFNKTLSNLGCISFDVEYHTFYYLPHKFFPLVALPYDIKVEIRKYAQKFVSNE